MSELRHRKDAAGHSHGAHSHAHAHSHGGAFASHDEEDDQPLVPAARSAFDHPMEGDADATASPAAPGVESMPDATAESLISEEQMRAFMEEAATTTSTTGSSGVSHNGTRLNLPPHLRGVFERRRAELLRQYPDLMTRDLTGDPHSAADAAEEGACACWRIDYVVMAVLLALLCYLVWTEYGINIPWMALKKLEAMLHPGELQRSPPSDANVGREAVEAAVRAVKEKMKQASGI